MSRDKIRQKVKYLSHFLQLFTDFKQIGDEMDYAEKQERFLIFIILCISYEFKLCVNVSVPVSLS